MRWRRIWYCSESPVISRNKFVKDYTVSHSISKYWRYFFEDMLIHYKYWQSDCYNRTYHSGIDGRSDSRGQKLVSSQVRTKAMIVVSFSIYTFAVFSVINRLNQASTLKPSVTMTCDFILIQIASEEFRLPNFTHNAWGNTFFFQTLLNYAARWDHLCRLMTSRTRKIDNAKIRTWVSWAESESFNRSTAS